MGNVIVAACGSCAGTLMTSRRLDCSTFLHWYCVGVDWVYEET